MPVKRSGKRLLACLLTGCLALGLSLNSVSARTDLSSFTDLQPGAWYTSWVKKALDAGLMTGLNERQYGPDEPMTRGMVATVFYRMGKGKAGWKRKFKDVPDHMYYSDAVTWAADNGIVTGYKNGTNTFGPDDPITRQDLAVIAARYLKHQGADTGKGADLSGFKDYKTVADYAKQDMAYIVKQRIITGSQGSLLPDANASRAECAKILYLTQQGHGDLNEKLPAPDSQEPQPDVNAAFRGYSRAGALSVQDGQLVDQNGEPMQLKGVSTHGLAWFGQYVNQADFSDLAKTWNANVIRLALYTEDYNGYCSGGNQEELKELVKNGVRYATQADQYAIVDWHILSDGNPLTHVDEAKAFFKEMSATFADQDNVLYEICNEPNGGTSWSDIKRYAEQVIPVIRKNSPNAIIIVGTPTWSQDVDAAAKDPITDYDNIMYTLHFYAATHKDDLRNRARKVLQQGFPLFVSEFGITEASGNGSIDTDSGHKWIDLLDQYDVSFVAWDFCNKDESAALIKSSVNKTSGFTDRDLTASGRFMKEVISGQYVPAADEDPGEVEQPDPDTPAAPSGSDEEKPETVTGSDGTLETTASPVNDWQENGKRIAQYDVKVNNDSEDELEGWSVTLTFSGPVKVRDVWNAKAQVDGNTITLTNMDYNASVAPRGNLSGIGMIVEIG